jgi:hypothetical protein
MEERKIGLSILAVIAIIALSGLVLLHTRSNAFAVYEQPGGNKPAYIYTSRYLPDFNLCNQYLCAFPSDTYYEEVEPAQQIGTDTLTGLLRCGCSSGHEFLIRPDRLEEGTYP